MSVPSDVPIPPGVGSEPASGVDGAGGTGGAEGAGGAGGAGTEAPGAPMPVRPSEVIPGEQGAEGGGGQGGSEESIEQPGKVMRIGSMVRQLLEEVRQAPLDEAGRARLKEIYEQSVRELADGLSPDLAAELDRMAAPFESATPSEAELRVAQAQLVGWLEGLFHGIQATLMAQQMAARAQLQEIRQRGLPPGQEQASVTSRPGTYL